MALPMDAGEETRALIDEARTGNRSAFDRVAEAHRERLLSFIRARLGSRLRGRIEAEDLLQDTYVRALEALPRFQWRGEGSVFAWLATIAENRIRALGRSPGTRTLPLEAEPADSGDPPSRGARREERFERLESALDSLSHDHREVVRLARVEGLPIAEVARRMHRTPGAVRHLLLRALERLRTGFGEETESLHLPDKRLCSDEGDADG